VLLSMALELGKFPPIHFPDRSRYKLEKITSLKKPLNSPPLSPQPMSPANSSVIRSPRKSLLPKSPLGEISLENLSSQ